MCLISNSFLTAQNALDTMSALKDIPVMETDKASLGADSFLEGRWIVGKSVNKWTREFRTSVL